MGLTPSPDNAAEIGRMVVPFARQNYGIVLDYSVESLQHVEGMLDDLRQDQKFEDLQPLLFSMGCYVGEVFVRNARAHWRVPQDVRMGSVASSPIVIVMPDGRGCNPVGKVYKRFKDGPGEDLAGFYEAMANAAPEKPGAGKEQGRRPGRP